MVRTTKLIYIAILILAIIGFNMPARGQDQRSDQPVHIPIDPYLNAIRKMPSLCVGHLEIVDFGPNKMVALHSTPGGRGTTYDFLLQFSGSRSSHVYIYPDDIDLDYGPTAQCNISTEIREKAIFSAEVQSGVVRGTFRVKDGDIVALEIPPMKRDKNGKLVQGMSLDLIKVVPSTYSVYGGSISLGESTVRMENTDEPLVKVDASPNLKPSSMRLRTQEATLSVDAGLIDDPVRRQQLSFGVVPGSSIEFKVPLETTGDVLLTNGRMLAGSFEPAKDTTHPAEFKVGAGSIAYAGINASSVALLATDGHLQALLRKASLDSVTARYSSKPRIIASDISRLAIDSIESLIEPRSSGIDFRPVALLKVKGQSDLLQLSSSSVVIKGPAALDVAKIDGHGVEGAISMVTSVATGLAGNAMLAKFESFDISGKSDNSEYQGAVNGSMSEFRVGQARINAETVLDGTFNKIGNLELSAKSTQPGLLAFLIQESSAIGFDAKLTNSVLAAEFSPTTGTLAIAPAGFHLDASNLESKQGRIIGGTPQFSQEIVHMQNPSEITLDETSAGGPVDFVTQSFSIVDPEIADTTRHSAFPLSGTLIGDTPIPLRTDLATGSLYPISGTLTAATGVNLTLPNGITSVTINVSGIDIELQSLKIDQLSLTASVTAPEISATATLAGKGIEINAKSVSSKSDPVFSGLLTAPFKIDSLSGTWRLAPTPVEFLAFEIDGADLKMASLNYSTPDRIALTASTGSLAIVTFAEKSAAGKIDLSQVGVHIEGADNNGSASAKAVSLDFSGTRANPSASGHVAFDTLAFGVSTGMEVSDNCKGSLLPIRISGQTGAVEGPISIVNGKTSFLLSINDMQFQLFRPSSIGPWSGCQWDQTLVGVSFDTPCADWCGGAIKYPCNFHMCRQEITIQVRWEVSVWGIQASGMLTQLKLEPDPGKGAKLCEGHLSQFNPPLFLPSPPIVYPTIPGGNAVSDAVRAYITTVAAATEGSVNQVLGQLGSLVSLTHIGNSIYLFGGCN